MHVKDRAKWGILGFLFVIVFVVIFASIFGSDPLTLIKDKFVVGTIIEPYFKFLCLAIFLIMLIVIVYKNIKDAK